MSIHAVRFLVLAKPRNGKYFKQDFTSIWHGRPFEISVKLRWRASILFVTSALIIEYYDLTGKQNYGNLCCLRQF